LYNIAIFGILLGLFTFVGNKINKASAVKRSKKEQKNKTKQCLTRTRSTVWHSSEHPSQRQVGASDRRRPDDSQATGVAPLCCCCFDFFSTPYKRAWLGVLFEQFSRL